MQVAYIFAIAWYSLGNSNSEDITKLALRPNDITGKFNTKCRGVCILLWMEKGSGALVIRFKWLTSIIPSTREIPGEFQ